MSADKFRDSGSGQAGLPPAGASFAESLAARVRALSAASGGGSEAGRREPVSPLFRSLLSSEGERREPAVRESARVGSAAGLSRLPSDGSVLQAQSVRGEECREKAAVLPRAVVAALQASAPPVVMTREFVFSEADFAAVRQKIYDFAGISLSPAKQDMVYGRLAKRLRVRGVGTFREYLALLERDAGEWEAFVNALTTNLTSFFREGHHFEILGARLRQWRLQRKFRIWCCAASTGEEPYSLAMTACEAFNTLRPPVEIVASDLNTQVLEDARRGWYGRERMGGVSEERQRRFFMPSEAGWEVREEVRQLVNFCRINLLEGSWPLQGRFDAIFCRNVMIYFDRETQYAVLQRFVPLLEVDGELYAGHSESFLHAADLFVGVGKTVYRRAR